MANEKETLSTKQAAEILHCTQSHANLLCRQGKIKAIRPFGHWMIDKEALEAKISLNGESEENDRAEERTDIDI